MWLRLTVHTTASFQGHNESPLSAQNGHISKSTVGRWSWFISREGSQHSLPDKVLHLHQISPKHLSLDSRPLTFMLKNSQPARKGLDYCSNCSLLVLQIRASGGHSGRSSCWDTGLFVCASSWWLQLLLSDQWPAPTSCCLVTPVLFAIHCFSLIERRAQCIGRYTRQQHFFEHESPSFS